MQLRTSKINLRPLEPEDLELLYLWENDPNLWHVGNSVVPFSQYILKQYLADSHRDIYDIKQLRLVIETTNQQAIGAIDLFDFDPNHQRAGIGILIYADEHRRKGYANNAIQLMCDYCRDVLGMHQIYANIGACNTASIALFEQCDFKFSGAKKDWLRRGKTWEDELIYWKKLL
ncbi:MAG: GNAT family N-acetyltransferase [Mangrovibacterium sp.]